MPEVALCIALVSLGWHVISWLRSRISYKYDTLDKHLCDLLVLAVERPCLRSDSWIAEQLAKTEEDTESLRYFAYAGLCLNIIETALDKYGDGISNTHFGPATVMLLKRHQIYYSRNKESCTALETLYESIT